MQKQRVKTSMSVPEMGKMLGLGKVESYWLVKKNYFKTIQVAGRMRVMLDSFEDWYAGQFHYKKVDGTPPGEKWRHTTMSVPEMADLLGLKSGTAYDLVKRGYFETTLIDRRIRIITSSFEAWYQKQSHYIHSDLVCIPSSRQLKKYKIFVLPGWISGNIFMPPIVAFHEIPLVLRLQVLSVAGRLYSNLYIL